MNRTQTEIYIRDMESRAADNRIQFRGRIVPLAILKRADEPPLMGLYRACAPHERDLTAGVVLAAASVGAAMWMAAFWLFTHHAILAPLADIVAKYGR